MEHTFKKIMQIVSYSTEVVVFIQKGKFRKIIDVNVGECPNVHDAHY